MGVATASARDLRLRCRCDMLPVTICCTVVLVFLSLIFESVSSASPQHRCAERAAATSPRPALGGTRPGEPKYVGVWCETKDFVTVSETAFPQCRPSAWSSSACSCSSATVSLEPAAVQDATRERSCAQPLRPVESKPKSHGRGTRMIPIFLESAQSCKVESQRATGASTRQQQY